MDCIYSLQDTSNRVFNCNVLDQMGKLLRSEDLPRFCEHCPIRLQSLRFLYMPPEMHSHSGQQ